MSITTFNVLTGFAYVLLVLIASYVSWKKGEKEGSVFMLEYLRENEFMNDTDYAKFMRHVRTEKKIENTDKLSPKELKKNGKKGIYFFGLCNECYNEKEIVAPVARKLAKLGIISKIDVGPGISEIEIFTPVGEFNLSED